MNPLSESTKKRNLKIMNSDAMLRVFGFQQSICSFCQKSMDDLNGKLMQCGKCRDVYFCSYKVRHLLENIRALLI
jgi:hypothetical protein